MARRACVLRLAAPVVLGLALTAGLAAQDTLFTVFGDAPGDNFGLQVAAAGDVDADGVQDLLVTAGDYVRVCSGVDGHVLHTFVMPSDAWLEGAGVGDVDGDGRDDILVADSFDDTGFQDAGKAVVYAGADGAVLFELFGDTAFDQLGFSATRLGDLDGDGMEDFGITTDDGELFSNPGTVAAFSGRSGTELWSAGGTRIDTIFGFDMDNAGDVDADGVSDLVVGSPGVYPETSIGVAIVFSGVDGSLLLQVPGNAAFSFATRVSGAGDVNRDGHDDILVGRPGNDGAGVCPCPGQAHVYSGLDGSVLLDVEGEANSHVGTSVDGLGDLNQDGWPDLLVGSTNGGVRVASGQDGSLLVFVPANPGEQLGTSVAALGDVNADGFVDFVASSMFSAAGPGYARCYSGYAAWYGQGQGLAGPAGTPLLEGLGSLTAGSPARLILTGGPPSSSAVLVIGFSTLGAPVAGGTLVPSPDVIVGGLVTDASGRWSVIGAWPAGVPTGFKAWFQVWFPGAPGSPALAASNGLMATTP